MIVLPPTTAIMPAITTPTMRRVDAPTRASRLLPAHGAPPFTAARLRREEPEYPSVGRVDPPAPAERRSVHVGRSSHVGGEWLPAGLGHDLPVDLAADHHGAGGHRRAFVVGLHLAVRWAVVLDLHAPPVYPLGTVRDAASNAQIVLDASVRGLASRMTSVQLRRYEIKPGEMERVPRGRARRVPVREQYGFGVAFALVDEERNEFMWAVTHDGDFAAAEADVLRVARARRVARQPGRPHRGDAHRHGAGRAALSSPARYCAARNAVSARCSSGRAFAVKWSPGHAHERRAEPLGERRGVAGVLVVVADDQQHRHVDRVEPGRADRCPAP